LTALKRKRAQSSASEGVTSARSTVTPAQLSANVGKHTSANVDANVGPAAKRSRRTTLSHAKQKKSDDSAATPAAVLFSDIRKKREEPETPKGKQTTKEDVKVPQNCETLTVVISVVKSSLI